MNLFDSHAHLDFSQYDGIRNDIIKESFDNGLTGIVNIGVDMASSRKSVELANRYESIWATVGFHPHDASKLTSEGLVKLEEMASSERVVAIGEIGLDFYRNLSPKKAQYEAFEKQIRLARKLNLPLVVHVREAYEEAIDVLAYNGAEEVGGVLHCFAGEEKHIDAGKKLGFVFSFNGTITFKKSRAPVMAEYAGIENILVETDCPFLAPAPYRGKMNKPVYVRYVAEKLAEIFAPLSPEEIGRITDNNARRLFGIAQEDSGRIAYVIRNSLYLNITNECSNNCFFCSRKTDYKIRGYNLRLNYEPTTEEIIKEAGDTGGYDEVVFCGYGEPTYRLDTLLEVARELKKRGTRLRLNTNGQGSLINGRNIAPDIAGVLDSVSISLNASNKERYNKICKPADPERAFDALLDFARECVGRIPEVTLSVVDIPKAELDECQRIADGIGAKLRIREYNKG
ncbi:MAG: YchF/TatD family DNA exonuclease [candidate division Zixibacteria bacterium]|nr:YchF/TatD family DNA exonuclease [candidate division Zixibacteria bacterium]